jgi:DNA-binding CsgD family transcriptional regulator
MGRVLGTLHLWRGEPADAVSWLERDARATDRGADTYVAALALPALGAALRRLGRHDEAASVLDRGVGVGRALGMPRVVADALEQHGHLAAPQDPDRAVDLHHEALSLRVEHGLRSSSVDSLDALAALAARLGRFDHAARVIAAADQARGAMGLSRHESLDAVVADLRTALGDGTFDDAWTAGAQLSLDDAVAYVRRSRGARGRPSGGWASLTPTELDVVRLAVEGYNNPEIGARLFMSRSTVKTHLSHVYAKLGVANRTELAALAGAHLAR